MPVTTEESGEQDRVARIERMLETYMAEHTKLHEETKALVTRVEQRSFELGERLDDRQRELSSSLMKLEAGIRAWRGVVVALVAVVSVLIGAFGAPILTELLSL
jgi:hypothetical protein